MKTTENQRFKIAREALILTQPQFAKCLEASHSTIAKIEGGGEVKEKYTNKLITLLNVSPLWIKEGKGEMFKSGTIQENIDRVGSLLSLSGNQQINPWEHALVAQIKEENLTLRQQIDKLTQAILNLSLGKANFRKALDVAGSPLYSLKGLYSGAKAHD
jgi:DNA-binding XRE family transcriptional regulator